MNPEVSVIIPFCNAEKTLLRAVKSILNQTFIDFELLLVDNNSSDKSLSIAQKLAESDSRMQILNEEIQGVEHAMNCGLKNAQGNLIARMDADDFSLPERLAKQVAYLNENNRIEFVGSEVTYVSHNENTAGFKRFVDWVNSFHSPSEIELNRFVEIPLINPSIVFKRSLYEKFGGCFSGDFPEDYELQLRYLNAGVKMAKLKEPLLEWHDYETRLTRTDKRYSTEAFFRIKAKYFKIWSEDNNQQNPKIWVWGGGRKTRQRAKLLENEGLQIEGFIDLVQTKTSLKKTIHYEDIPNSGKIFIVPMVTNTGASKRIKEYLLSRNYIEGKDFILMG